MEPPKTPLKALEAPIRPSGTHLESPEITCSTPEVFRAPSESPWNCLRIQLKRLLDLLIPHENPLDPLERSLDLLVFRWGILESPETSLQPHFAEIIFGIPSKVFQILPESMRIPPGVSFSGILEGASRWPLEEFLEKSHKKFLKEFQFELQEELKNDMVKKSQKRFLKKYLGKY